MQGISSKKYAWANKGKVDGVNSLGQISELLARVIRFPEHKEGLGWRSVESENHAERALIYSI